MSETIRIHTSDRIAFKTCRRAWNWSSPIRGALRSASTPEALWFGTLVHRGLEAFYLGDDPHMVLSEHGFEHRAELIGKEPTIEAEERYLELMDLAQGMLTGYVQWVDISNLITVGTEVRFRIPLNVPGHVYYCGKADALVYDTKTKLLWIVEFKTTAQFGNPDFLAWDEQCTSYAWAFECIREGIGSIDESTLVQPDLFWDATRIEGILYDDLRKKTPTVPKVLVSGAVSMNKQQDTTYEVYRAFLEENGFKTEAYADFLAFLKSKPNNFFRRHKVRRNSSELAQVGMNVHMEAFEMTQPSLALYPNPGYRANNCQRCGFKAPCLALNDGQTEEDIQSYLDSSYIVKDSFEGDEFFVTGSVKEVSK